jgi:hypothetical protein
MKPNIGMGVALVTALALLGCKETTSSEFIRTGGIAALIDVTADSADSSTVHVELRVGGDSSNTYVKLQGGDKLSAAAGTEQKDLQAVEDGVYEGTFATGKAVEFTVNFERTEDADAPANKGTLPTPFEIKAPLPADEHSRADDAVTITWDKVANTEGTISVDGPCIFPESYTVSGDAGTYAVAKGDLTSLDDMKPESCKVDIDLSFKREGSTDGAFDSESHFFTYQNRTTSFMSTP